MAICSQSGNERGWMYLERRAGLLGPYSLTVPSVRAESAVRQAGCFRVGVNACTTQGFFDGNETRPPAYLNGRHSRKY